MQFTLTLSIALVILVIFVFLRSVWATIIPSVAIPMALLGTFVVMYFCGYSLDNLSLLALTRFPSASLWTMPSSCSRTSSATSRPG